MNSNKVFGLLIISVLLVSALEPTPSSAAKVIFYGPPKVLHSQLLTMVSRKAPCPKGKIRDHRNICRKALTFSRLAPR
ncbi:uncharacterized protein LOC131996870 [Stomoxys calcitrans]|uniref:uncharacterized protein LOC131996870 n=1 Tax=Stomoxys calcitrans TaxID=35570 RepID=UPI0027E21B75|nr:uncharacterized protein LOC131996870 [Stomoxys calcitrans]